MGGGEGAGSPGGGHDAEGRAPRVSRRRALLGGLAAGAAAAGMQGRADAANGDPLILATRNTATGPTELLEQGRGPALTVSQVSGAHDDAPFPDGLAAGLAGIGQQFGMLGSTLLPGELAITEVGPDLRAGVAGLGQRFGMLGSTLMPRELAMTELSPDLQAGVAGLGHRFGVLGSTLLPSELAITMHSDVGVSGVGHGVGVWGVQGGGSRPPRLAAAGVLGSASGQAAGVAAENEAGFAFRSLGKLAFSTAGEGLIRSGQRMGMVENSAIQPDSLANVTLLSDPGAKGGTLMYARPTAGALEVYLTSAARRDIRFAYFVFHSLPS